MAVKGNSKFMGYRRENGRVGVRNHVVILPVDDISNAACEARRQQHQGHDGAAACLRAAAVRRGPRPALPHHDRHRREPERRRLHRHRHRAGLDGEDRRRHRQDRQAGGGLLHRAERRPEDHHGRLAQGQGVRPLRHRAAARALRRLGALGLDQMRRERHHDRPRLLPDRRQHVRQAASRRASTASSARPRRSPAASTSARRARRRRRSASAGTRCARPIRTT